MAQKSPIVLGTDGLLQQLQSGDTLIGGSETGQIVKTAAAVMIPGNVVYASSGTQVNKGQANAAATTKILGLAVAAIANAANGTIQTNGILTLTTTQWDAVAGTTGGLTVGSYYFLSAASAGLLTSTPPSTAGQYVVCVGQAIASTELNIDIEKPILL